MNGQKNGVDTDYLQKWQQQLRIEYLSGFFADSQIRHMKIKRQKPRREGRPRMSENILSSVQSN